MKTFIILLFAFQTLYANNFREESIDLGKGVSIIMVNLKNGFWVGKYEVTQGQWLAVMGKPTDLALLCTIYDPKLRGDNKPMDSMGLMWAEKFCKEVSQKTGRKIRLPTELEWEFYANGTSPSDAVWSMGLNAKTVLRGPADVGSKGPNRFGLYDTLGNVMELCSGNWNDYKNPKTGKVWKGTPILMGGGAPWAPCRGGCYWFNSVVMMKVEFRDFAISQSMRNAGGVGFRVVVDGDK